VECGQREIYCGGACIPVSKEHCGDCETQCQEQTSCHCEEFGASYRCWSNSTDVPCER
jgi:hypothetical protein